MSYRDPLNVDGELDETVLQGLAAMGAADVRQLRVLVAQPPETERRRLEDALAIDGYEVATVDCASDLLEKFAQFAPELVILDTSLADGDPHLAMARLRSASGTRWVPVVLLSPSVEQHDVARGLDAGASDVLAKPVDVTIAQARLNSLRRIVDMQNALQRYRHEAETEAALARGIMERMVDSAELHDPRLAWRVTPASAFSGDQIAAARGPSGRFYVLLADAAGHGLAAAITLLPMLLVFHSMARKDFTVSQIVSEMNSKLKEVLVPGRYAAATLVCHDRARGEVEYWNGGVPAGVMLDRRGHAVIELPSTHLPLGIVDATAFDASCEVLEAHGSAMLVLHSDGLIEAQNSVGEPFGKDRLRQSMVGPAADVDARMLAHLHRHLDGRAVQDDVSVAAISLA